jgi:hypothetical protein
MIISIKKNKIRSSVVYDKANTDEFREINI